MSNCHRRLDKPEPKPDHDERMKETGGRIHHAMIRWREWLLRRGPPTRFSQGKIDEAVRHCGGFAQEEPET
jgi:hypothetical protein